MPRVLRNRAIPENTPTTPTHHVANPLPSTCKRRTHLNTLPHENVNSDDYIDVLRLRRNAAMARRQDEAAIFWAEQVLAATGSTIDVHTLATCLLNAGQVGRALSVLQHGRGTTNNEKTGDSPDLLDRKPTTPRNQRLNSVIDQSPLDKPSYIPNSRDHTRISIACRNLAVHILLILDRVEEALEFTDETRMGIPIVDPVPSLPGEVSRKAALYTLRGAAHVRKGDMMLARDCFLKALSYDITAYEAFAALVEYNLLSPKEECAWFQAAHFNISMPNPINNQNRHSNQTMIPAPDGPVIRELYRLHLSPLSNTFDTSLSGHYTSEDELADKLQSLADIAPSIYRSSPLVSLTRARYYIMIGAWSSAEQIMSDLLILDPYHPTYLTMFIQCARILHNENLLFKIAHTLHDLCPSIISNWNNSKGSNSIDQTRSIPSTIVGSGTLIARPAVPLSSSTPIAALFAYASGSYYATVGRIAEARRQFVRATTIDELYVAGWLAYSSISSGDPIECGGKFDTADECTSRFVVDDKEYEYAMGNLSVASKIAPNCPGIPLAQARTARSHRQHAVALAYYRRCIELCSSDPVVCCEIGLVHLDHDEFDNALKYLLEAYKHIHLRTVLRDVKALVHLGLAKAFLGLSDHKRALTHAEEALVYTCASSYRRGSIFQIIAQVHLTREDYHEAVSAFQAALNFKPGDASLTEGLTIAVRCSIVVRDRKLSTLGSGDRALRVFE